jgi:hypothetical protein
MNSVKYIGMDVHASTISAAVLNGEGKLLMQTVLARQAGAILDFLKGLRGTLHLTLEEGTQSAWLYDLLAGRVARVVVSNPRKQGSAELVWNSAALLRSPNPRAAELENNSALQRNNKAAGR